MRRDTVSRFRQRLQRAYGDERGKPISPVSWGAHEVNPVPERHLISCELKATLPLSGASVAHTRSPCHFWDAAAATAPVPMPVLTHRRQWSMTQAVTQLPASHASDEEPFGHPLQILDDQQIKSKQISPTQLATLLT